MKKRLMTLLATGAFVGAMMAGGAGSALAGEVTGNGDTTPIKDPGVAASICAFSGLEDDEQPTGPGNTQNWGQEARGGAHFGGPALFGCNPNNPPAPH